MFYESVDFIVCKYFVRDNQNVIVPTEMYFYIYYLINYVIQIIFHSLDREIQCHLQHYHKVIIHDNVNNHTKCVPTDNKFIKRQ
jgi:hypothetical protein